MRITTFIPPAVVALVGGGLALTAVPAAATPPPTYEVTSLPDSASGWVGEWGVLSPNITFEEDSLAFTRPDSEIVGIQLMLDESVPFVQDVIDATVLEKTGDVHVTYYVTGDNAEATVAVHDRSLLPDGMRFNTASFTKADGTTEKNHSGYSTEMIRNLIGDPQIVAIGLRISTVAQSGNVYSLTFNGDSWAFHAPVPEPEPTPTPTPQPVKPAPDGTDLTDSNRGDVAVVGQLRAGGEVTVNGGSALAGVTADLYLFSTPIALGTRTFDANGSTTVRLPADLSAGVHRIAVYSADGEVLGWASITVVATLAATGVNAEDLMPVSLLAGSLLVAGAALALSRRRLGSTRA